MDLFSFLQNLINKRKQQQATAKQDEANLVTDDLATEVRDDQTEINNHIVIHTMPERFRSAQIKVRQAKTVGIFIISAGLIFLIAVSLLLFYYLVQKPDLGVLPLDGEAERVTEIVSGPQPPEDQSPQTDRPGPTVSIGAKDTYLAMKQKFSGLTIFSDYQAMIREYGSENKLLELNQQVRDYNSLSGPAKNGFILALASSSPPLAEIGEIKEQRLDQTATLEAVTKDLSRRGIIIMVLEGDRWKLDSEVWTEPEQEIVDDSEQAVEQTELEFIQDSDGDGDGLTDTEEQLLGTDPNLTDSDIDSYDDFTELAKLYNPAGPGRLIDSDRIKHYLNNNYNYGLLYPAAWSSSAIGGLDSVIFISPDNQFIQMIVQPNNQGQTLEQWYRQQFNVETVKQEQIIAKDGWQGIKNEDGLTVYLVNDQTDYIFTLAYNPGQNGLLSYLNIFAMVIESLSLLD